MTEALPLIRTIQERLIERWGRPSPVIEYTLATLWAGGHILLEDIPGVGKTTFVQILGQVLGLPAQRIQFTADLMPADLIGVEIYLAQEGRFQFRPGPLFHSLILADELNRASPKTQSALLQAMTDEALDIGRERYPLPRPFILIATQNPVTFEGTYPLPESQLDRFMVKLSLGYPPPEVERRFLQQAHLKTSEASLSLSELPQIPWEACAEWVNQVKVTPELVDYLYRLVEQTRNHPEIKLGISLRGGLMWMRLCKSLALCRGRRYVIPDDIYESFIRANWHRMIFTQPPHGEAVMTALLEKTPMPV